MDYDKEDYRMLYNEKQIERGPGLPWGVWAILALAAVAIAMSGCATIINEHSPAPQGWPALTVTENSVSGPEIIRRCYKHLPLTQKLLGSFPMGCAEVRFDLNTCTIWYVYDATPEIIEHERQHCSGLSHVGESWASDALAAWRATK